MENEVLDNMIILTDEKGSRVRFEFLDLIEYQNREYLVLLPADDEDDTGEVVILQIESFDDENENYISVDDQDTLYEVFSIFKEKFKEEFSFLEDE